MAQDKSPDEHPQDTPTVSEAPLAAEPQPDAVTPSPQPEPEAPAPDVEPLPPETPAGPVEEEEAELVAPDADLLEEDEVRPAPSFLGPRGVPGGDGTMAMTDEAGATWVAGGWTADVAAAVLTASLVLAYCFSYGALIFSGPFSPFLGFGISASLLTGVVTGVVVAWRGQFPFGIAGPDSNATAILAAMVSGLAPLAATLSSDMARLSLVMAALMGSSLVTGLVLFLLGWQRAGRLVRYFPYPVMAGFLAATGWLIVTGAVRMVSGHSLSWAGLPTLFDGLAPYQIGLTVLWAAVLLIVPRFVRGPAVLPLALVAATVVTHGVLWLAGLSPEQAQHDGWLFAVSSERNLWLTGFGPLEQQGADFPSPWSLLSWDQWHGASLKIAGDVLAVVVVSCLSILMNATGIEMATGREADLDRELKAEGQANILSACLGGFVGYLSVSRSLLNYGAGGRGRLSGILVGLVCLLVLAVGPAVVGVIPRFVLGGLLLLLGVRLLWDWLVQSRRRLSFVDWLVVVGLVLLAAHFGFLVALFAGILAGCVIFTLDFSRVSVVRARFGVHEHPSSLIRPPEDMAVLAAHGHKVQVIVLRSFIFFGSAHRLYEMVKALVAEQRPHALVFDFHQVSGIDSSAAASFSKIASVLREAECHLCISGIAPTALGVLRAARVIDQRVSLYEALDPSLEDLENALLAYYREGVSASRPFVDWLSDSLGPIPGDDDSGSVLLAYLERLHLPAGTYLCHGGDATSAMHFVENGRLSVLLESPGKPSVRVRAMARLSVVGEMGFFLNAPRSAGLRAEEDCVLWALTADAYHRLELDHPHLVQALMGYIIRLQAERLSFANRQILALSR
ncbi:SLC26A/SulP transporter family protein [Insolitispirillum peregrinum]|uniref:SLC26A/SulP transporter family protein n=1 Tax=Insolitispirillum peregrinum TaxID=80876 RepID=UPI00360A9ADA